MNLSSARLLGLASVLALAAAGCGGGEVPPAAPPPAAPTAPPPAPVATHAPDLPDAPPAPSLAAPFQPPAPAVYKTANGMTVWLLERHALPLVAVTVAVPTGASSDPKGAAGLAGKTADMLDEGAGKLGAIDLAKAIDQLGANLSTYATLDSSVVRLNVVKRNFAPAMQLLGDVVARPRFDAKEWTRVHDLWENDLKERASEPRQVAAVVDSAVFFGPDHPYGHPVDGLLSMAPKVTLPDVKRFYTRAWRPDQVVIVAVGDVTKEELDAQLTAALGSWKAPAGAPAAAVIPPVPAAAAGGPYAKGRVVLVDRPDAPQAVVRVVRPGVSANDARFPPLARANIAVGGSFTSRLNTDLREKKGWTYGAFTSVTKLRGVGEVSSGASFVTEHAVDGLKAMLSDLEEFARGGMTDDEALKTRLQSRGDVVDDYETVDRASAVLAKDAVLGLGPDWEAKASVAADGADRATLNKLEAPFYQRAGSTIEIVGPRAKLEAALTEAGFEPVEILDAEGRPVKGAEKAVKTDGKGAERQPEKRP